MSISPEQPQKPLLSVTSPPEGSDTDVAGSPSSKGANVDPVKVLQEGRRIWKLAQANNGTLNGEQIDLSASPYTGITKEAALNKMDGANKFVGAFTGSESRTALNDWIFGDDKNNVTHTKGETVIHALNADGLAVTADIKKDKITGSGDGWKVEHDPKSGATIYESKEFRATEKDGVKTIEDKERGTKLQWDSKTKHGIVYDSNGKVSFEFSSLSQFEEEVKARLTDDRYLHLLNTKHAYDQAVRDHFNLHIKNPHLTDAEHIYADGNGDFSVITKDGLLYQYDKATKTTYLEKGGVKIRVHDGKAYSEERDAATGATHEVLIRDFKQYHALGLGTVVGTDGALNQGNGQTNFNSLIGRLTTNSDNGPVSINSANGTSTLETRTGNLTLQKDGSIDNSRPETQILEHYDKKTDVLVGRTKDGGTHVIDSKDIHITEKDGRQADLYDNGAVNVRDKHGKELFSVDSRGNTSVAGQFTVGADGDVKHHGKHVGNVDASEARSTGISTWADASAEISGAYGELTLDNIGVVEGQLRNDYNILTDLAARVTARGNVPVANILMARANSILEAINNLEGQKTQLQNRPPHGGTQFANRDEVGTNNDRPASSVAASYNANSAPLRHRPDSTGGMVAAVPGADIQHTDQPGIVSTPEPRRNA